MFDPRYKFIEYDTQEDMAQFILDCIYDETIHNICFKGTKEEFVATRRKYTIGRLEEEDYKTFNNFKPYLVILSKRYKPAKEIEKIEVDFRKIIDWKTIEIPPKPDENNYDEMYEWRKVKRYKKWLRRKEYYKQYEGHNFQTNIPSARSLDISTR